MANLSIIRELCKEKNISLKKLGQEIGIKTPQGVQRMINENSTTIDRLERIAKLLNVPIWIFFDLDPELSYKKKIESLEKDYVELDKNYSRTIDLNNEKERYIAFLNKTIVKLNAKINSMRMAITLLTTQGRLLSTGNISIESYDVLLNSMITFIGNDFQDSDSDDEKIQAVGSVAIEKLKAIKDQLKVSHKKQQFSNENQTQIEIGK